MKVQIFQVAKCDKQGSDSVLEYRESKVCLKTVCLCYYCRCISGSKVWLAECLLL